MFRTRTIVISALAVAAATAAVLPAVSASADQSGAHGRPPVSVDIKSPQHGANAGIAGADWLIDLSIGYPGGPGGLRLAGFTAPQLTGPAGHNDVPPLPGTFSTGQDDRLPGLIVLDSTASTTLPGFSGPGTNLANLFNVTGVTNRTQRETEIGDTWIVAAPIAGVGTGTTLTVAVVADLNHDGVYNDAPGVLTDLNHDGKVDQADLVKLGVASNIATVRFHLNGQGA